MHIILQQNKYNDISKDVWTETIIQHSKKYSPSNTTIVDVTINLFALNVIHHTREILSAKSLTLLEHQLVC